MLPITKNITKVNRTVLSGKINKYIVIHYTGNRTDKAASNANYFKTINRGASAHYFVDATSIYQVVEDKDASWAVGRNYGKGNLFNVVKNNNSINIEMCSTNGRIDDKTFSNTIDLTKYLMKKYNIPASHVYRHYDVCSKACPGWTGWIPGNETLWKKFKSKLTRSVSTPSNSESKPSSGSSKEYVVQINTDSLNVRKGPGTKYNKVTSLKKGGKFTIVDTKNGWGLLKAYEKGRNGWIKLSYTKKV